jgi:outer membrane protein assembly factor BamB
MVRRLISRREALAGLGLLVASSAARRALAQAPAPPADSWMQFRGNPRLTGVAASALPATPKLVWSYEAGDVIDSSAAIAGNTVYIGAGDGHLVALDFASGKLRWKYATGTLLGESSPAVSGTAVYIGDMDGVVHAVKTADGARVWTFKTTGEIKASPIVVRDMVLIGSYDTHLYALDARTGALRWKLETKGPVHATLALLGDLVFVAGCDSIFRAIRVTSGTQAYEIDAGAYVGASPVVDGDRAYFGTYENEVLALDLRARRVLWRYSDPTRQFPFVSSAALSQGRIVLGGRDKHVHSIDIATGKAAWTFATRARVESSPVIAGGRVYVGSFDGRLYVLDERTGQKTWEFDAGDAIGASPAIAAGRLVVGARNGIVYCLG